MGSFLVRLAVSSPRQNLNTAPLTEIRVGVADAYSGVNNATLSVKADFPVNGAQAGTESRDDLAKPAGAWTTLNQLNAVDEPDQSRRLEVELPSGVQGSRFLRVQKP